ncbi:MAG: hypothetical protein U1A23_00005, partial [Candidatus Sungbacteria bacterium]|nr:hypothetical protein [Candidatus Sungbacteria bacterium]
SPSISSLSPSPSPSATIAPSSVSPTPSVKLPALSADEQAVLKSASDLKLVERLAKESSVLKITQCRPTPIVLKVKVGNAIMIKNDDSVEYIMSFGEKIITLKANETTEIPSSFTKGGGVFGYGCNGSQGAVGIVFAVQ